ncbi:aldehyde dehydrogenase family protein [Nocardia seriolae]|uniref:aldehyde dehydrogenase family protein n=1 Tax=Nocardia seriolae TaxID=37332 RepID=UPI0008FF6C5D|nr:aldehyde dehydrogenase family protein [Nocardia seriolae]OJF78276.1 aldehyde dehydrogenase [Nocardia seriolae]PSK28365.1 aldehyde dehydrogenase [Nocardia seriolae]QOW31498.1 aldehyde dehydrogenase family protein [Nocardia seriolae]QUN19112.1 aldehyde dehydrogenase family protein [Nocardia seriolae]
MAESAQPATGRAGASRSKVLTSYDPRTGEVVGEYAGMGAGELTRTVRAARGAEQWWAALGFDARKRWLLDWKRSLARGTRDLVELISSETGKPRLDAAIEVTLAVEHLDWVARHAEKTRSRPTRLATVLRREPTGTVGYLPLGVVGVLGPWHNPVLTPMNSIAGAMASGNAVVFKPSELTPGVGAWLADTWNHLAPNQPVLQVVTGDSSTAAALCRAAVDKLAYAGSGAGAREVAELAAQASTPLVVEQGGRGAMVVQVDAKLDAAAAAAVYGSMANAGQQPAGVQCVYVADSVYEPFLELVADQARRLRPGADRRASYGPMTMDAQIDVVRRQVRDAVTRGARLVVGSLESIREPYIEPIVLTEVPEVSTAVTGTAVGPVLVVNRVATMDEAAERVNAARRPRTVAVFTRDLRSVPEFAARLRSELITVNSVPVYGVNGPGRIRDPRILREFARPQTITDKHPPDQITSGTFDKRPRRLRVARAVFRMRHRV